MIPVHPIIPPAHVDWYSLPEEMIHQIIKCVQEGVMCSERHLILCKKRERLVELSNNRWVYPPNDNPILNSFQSLAAVNRQLYRLCRPILWEDLSFPSSVPKQMSHWTQDLLPRHGSYVQSIDMELSKEWSNVIASSNDGHILGKPIPEQFTSHPESKSTNILTEKDPIIPTENIIRDPDNMKTSLDENRPEPLSPASVREILDLCPNAESLYLFNPIYEGDFHDYLQNNESFGRRMITILQTLPKLRNLVMPTFNCKTYNIDATTMAQILLGLPLLETLLYFFSTTPDSISLRNFVTNLSKLNNLRHLDINFFVEEDVPWPDSQPSKTLCNLKLLYVLCPSFIGSQVPLGISCFAPNLTYLDLQVVIFPGSRTQEWNEMMSCDKDSNESQLFKLPALTHLVIHIRSNFDLFLSFRRSQQIQTLTYHGLQDCQWASITHLICSSTWPKLKEIQLQRVTGEFESLPELVSTSSQSDGDGDLTLPRSVVDLITCQDRLQEFCDKEGIELQIA